MAKIIKQSFWQNWFKSISDKKFFRYESKFIQRISRNYLSNWNYVKQASSLISKAAKIISVLHQLKLNFHVFTLQFKWIIVRNLNFVTVISNSTEPFIYLKSMGNLLRWKPLLYFMSAIAQNFVSYKNNKKILYFFKSMVVKHYKHY